MTFGEHLEELRRALFLAAGGLLVGFLVALLIAPTVVRWIEWPLREALEKHYLEMAKLEHPSETPESAANWSSIDRLKMVPRQVYVDQQMFSSNTAGRSDDQCDYEDDDIRPEDCVALCEQLTRYADDGKRPESALYQRLAPDDVQLIEEIAKLGTCSEGQLKTVRDALNSQIHADLFRSDAFSYLDKVVTDQEYAEVLQRQRRSALDAGVNVNTAQLNRLLIDAVFAGKLAGYRPELQSITIWEPVEVNVQALSVHEPFMIYIKASLVVGLILSSPWVFYQIWSFVAAGLYPHEKTVVYKFLPFSLGLFLAGAALAFFFVFEPVLDFLFRFNRQLNISAEPRISDWISFVLLLPVGFGVSFQLPLVMLLLEKLGICTMETYWAHWRTAVLIVFVLSMFLTPADPISMLLMAVPLTILYFGGIGLCHVAGSRTTIDTTSESLTTS